MTPLDLKVWRVRHELTQAELAQRLKVHTNTVNRWETGASDIPGFLDLALETLERRVAAGQPLETNPAPVTVPRTASALLEAKARIRERYGVGSTS